MVYIKKNKNAINKIINSINQKVDVNNRLQPLTRKIGWLDIVLDEEFKRMFPKSFNCLGISFYLQLKVSKVKVYKEDEKNVYIGYPIQWMIMIHDGVDYVDAFAPFSLHPIITNMIGDMIYTLVSQNNLEDRNSGIVQEMLKYTNEYNKSKGISPQSIEDLFDEYQTHNTFDWSIKMMPIYDYIEDHYLSYFDDVLNNYNKCNCNLRSKIFPKLDTRDYIPVCWIDKESDMLVWSVSYDSSRGSLRKRGIYGTVLGPSSVYSKYSDDNFTSMLSATKSGWVDQPFSV